jgi:hypothetical protein
LAGKFILGVALAWSLFKLRYALAALGREIPALDWSLAAYFLLFYIVGRLASRRAGVAYDR